MIIRSQDKKTITNDLNLRITTEERILSCSLKEEFPHQAMCRILDANNAILGDYSTEEKAIKVLDMICENYKECKMCESGRRQIADIEFSFQMPQDSEV